MDGDALWKSLEPILSCYIQNVLAREPSLTGVVRRSPGASFLLRGYAAVRRRADGEEIAITVDAAVIDGAVTLSSDICMDSGEVLAEGPQAKIALGAMSITDVGPLANWISDFQTFLSTVKPDLIVRVAKHLN